MVILKRIIYFQLAILLIMSGQSRHRAYANLLDAGVSVLVSGDTLSIQSWFDKPDTTTVVPIPAFVPTKEISEHPTLLSETHTWTAVKAENITFRFRYHNQINLNANRAAFNLLQHLNGVAPPMKQRFSLNVEMVQTKFAAFDIRHTIRSNNWEAWIEGGLIAPIYIAYFDGAGAGGFRDDTNPFFLEFVSARAHGGYGFSLGGGIQFQNAKYVATISGRDIFSRIYWPQTDVRRGLINSNNVSMGSDGYLWYAPLASGRWATERWITKPWQQWKMTFAPREAEVDGSDSNRKNAMPSSAPWALSFEQLGRHLRVEWRKRITSDHGFHMGLSGPILQPDVGFYSSGWTIGIGTDSLDLLSARSLNLWVSREFAY